MNRDFIKYISILAMACNHYALVFLTPDTLVYEILVNIGHFTAPVMCYFLVEGFYYTRDRKKYGQRLLAFGVVSQIPYLLAIPFRQLNIILTLFVCFLILCVLNGRRSEYDKNRLVLLLSGATIFMDWALFAPFFTLLFVRSRGDKRNTFRAFGIGAMAYAGLSLLTFFGFYPLGEALFKAVYSSLGIVVAGIVITCFYNGRQSKRGRNFSKWFFYIFYPLHLLVFWLIKVFV